MGAIHYSGKNSAIPLYSAAQIDAWDKYTIEHEPVASFLLMERASRAFAQRFLKLMRNRRPVIIVCGSGNNGGDGFAIARLLVGGGLTVTVYQFAGSTQSKDTTANQQMWLDSGKPLHTISTEEDFPELGTDDVCIDAIFGIGLNKPVTGIKATFINHLNRSGSQVIAVDLPSGMDADTGPIGEAVVQAAHTLSFQCLKQAMLLPEAERYFGKIHILDIGLSARFEEEHPPLAQMVMRLGGVVPPQQLSMHAHKGVRGHALLVAGSPAMMGAAVLTARAAIHSGCGLVTAACDEKGWPVLQTAVPETMCTEVNSAISPDFLEYRKIRAIGIGPGLELNEANSYILKNLIEHHELPLLIDASAIKLLKEYLPLLEDKNNSTSRILTPHAGEFEYLFGKTENELQRWKLAREMSLKYKCVILLKGAYSMVFTPGGNWWINNTGNAGMAKGGSGDVLTGLITGLIAKGYTTEDAAVAGMYLHGKAGDLASESTGMEGMSAMGIIGNLSAALKDYYA